MFRKVDNSSIPSSAPLIEAEGVNVTKATKLTPSQLKEEKDLKGFAKVALVIFSMFVGLDLFFSWLFSKKKINPETRVEAQQRREELASQKVEDIFGPNVKDIRS